MTTNRLEAFSDGVFAVAITFLVFNIAVPTVGNGRLWRALLDQWPHYAAYAVSFLVIGIIWINHHGIFHRIARVDRPLIFLNLLLLMSVAVIPFPTALLAQYIRDGGSNSHVAAAVYSVTMTVMAIAFSLIWGYVAYHPDLLEDSLDPTFARSTLPRFAAGVFVYVPTIGIAFINAVACLVIHALLALYYVFDQIAGEDGLGAPTDKREEVVEEVVEEVKTPR